MNWQYLYWCVFLGIVTFAASIVTITVLLVHLPATYFLDSHERQLWIDRHTVIRWTGLVLKNFLGFFLVLIGVVLSVPGVPGQGLLTVLLGFVLLDFPGKRRLERKLLSRPYVRTTVDRWRARFGRGPLMLEDHIAEK